MDDIIRSLEAKGEFKGSFADFLVFLRDKQQILVSDQNPKFPYKHKIVIFFASTWG